jgi:hypothetical protein
MTPEQIAERFGTSALERLYDVILDRSTYDLVEWILSFYTEHEIQGWLNQLQEDEDENANAN